MLEAADPVRAAHLLYHCRLAVASRLEDMGLPRLGLSSSPPDVSSCPPQPNSAASTYGALLSRASPSDRQRLLESADTAASAWLLAPRTGDTQLSSPVFADALCLRLGLNTLPAESLCPLHCIPCDARGHHALSCQLVQGHVTDRHDLLVDGLVAEVVGVDSCARNLAAERRAEYLRLLASGVPESVAREVRAASTTRPGDFTFRLGGPGQPLSFYDVTVCNSLTDSALLVASKNPLCGHTADGAVSEAAHDKDCKHLADVASAGGLFHPLAVSVLGFWDRTSLACIYRICACTGPRKGLPASSAAHALLASLSCALMRGNHSVLHATRSPQPPRPVPA